LIPAPSSLAKHVSVLLELPFATDVERVGDSLRFLLKDSFNKDHVQALVYHSY
jgi:hypothetical protein